MRAPIERTTPAPDGSGEATTGTRGPALPRHRAYPASQREPWFALAAAAGDPANPVRVWTRGERSFVVIVPPSQPPSRPPPAGPT